MFQLHSSLRERSGRRQPSEQRSSVLSFGQIEYHQAADIRRSTWYQVPILLRVCTGLFAFVVIFVLPLGLFRVIFFANYTRIVYCRSERDMANIPHGADREISSAQVHHGIIKSLVALIIRGPPLSASFIFS